MAQSNEQILRENLTPEEYTLIEQLGYQHIPLEHIRVFLMRADSMHLDPQNSSEITIIERKSKKYGSSYTVQVGIAGYRRAAREVSKQDGTSFSESDAYFCGEDGQWREIWSCSRSGYPMAAKVIVTRDGQEFSNVVMWEEAVQTTYNGDPQALWNMNGGRPTLMLGKNAAAGAYRKAFPDQFAGTYVDGEVPQTIEPPKQNTNQVVIDTNAQVAAPVDVTDATVEISEAGQQMLEQAKAANDRDEITRLWKECQANLAAPEADAVKAELTIQIQNLKKQGALEA